MAVDTELFRLLNGLSGNPVLDGIMIGLSSVAVWGGIAAAFVLYAVARRSRTLIRLCLVLAVTIGASDFVTYQVLKPAVGRARPCYALKDVHLVASRCGSDVGFPSNHAANSMAAAVILAAYAARRRARLAIFGAAVLVGLSRVYLGVHYPLDVLAAFGVGGVFGALARFFYKSPERSKTTLGLRDAAPSTLE